MYCHAQLTRDLFAIAKFLLKLLLSLCKFKPFLLSFVKCNNELNSTLRNIANGLKMQIIDTSSATDILISSYFVPLRAQSNRFGVNNPTGFSENDMGWIVNNCASLLSRLRTWSVTYAADAGIARLHHTTHRTHKNKQHRLAKVTERLFFPDLTTCLCWILLLLLFFYYY